MTAINPGLQRTVDAYIRSIDWSGLNESRLIETLKRKYIRIRPEARQPFLERAVESNAYAAGLFIRYHKNSLGISDEQIQLLTCRIRDTYLSLLCDDCTHLIAENPEQLAYPLAYFFHIDDQKAYRLIFQRIKESDLFARFSSSLQESDQDQDPLAMEFFYRVFSILRNSPQQLQMTAHLASVIYDELGPEAFRTLILTIGSSKYRVEIMIMDRECTDLRRLLDIALETNDLPMIYSLERIFRDLNLRHIGISDEELVKRLFCLEEKMSFHHAFLLTDNMISKKYSLRMDGINRLCCLLSQYENSDNPVWSTYRHWFRVYLLSQKIQCDTAGAEHYIAEFIPDPVTKHNIVTYTRTVSEIIQGVIESLIREQKPLLLEYLTLIDSLNVYRENVIRHNSYCSYADCKVDCNNIVQLLQELGYTKEQIIYIFMNSHYRRLLSFEHFLRMMSAATGFTGADNLFDNPKSSFNAYSFAATYDHNSRAFQLRGLNTEFLELSPSWQKNHPNYCAAMLNAEHDGQEFVIKLLECKPSTFRCTAYPVLSSAESESYDSSEKNYQLLMDYLRQIECSGALTTEMNLQISMIPQIYSKGGNNAEILTDQDIELNVQYLKCCAAIAEKGPAASDEGTDPLRYFVNMITRPGFCIRNKYKYHSNGKSARVIRYSQEIFFEVLNCWKKLSTSAYSIDDVFFVYINTILKHCITFSSVMNRYCTFESGPVKFDALFKNYTNYWFGGSEMDSLSGPGKIAIRPNDICSYSKRFGMDNYVYLLAPGEVVDRKNRSHRFTIDSYDRTTNTFFLGQLDMPHARDILPSATFVAALKDMAHRREIYLSDIRNINEDHLQFSEKQQLMMIDPILSGLYIRAADCTSICEYMTLLHRNNPWKFSCDQLTVLPANDKLQYALTQKALRLLRKLISAVDSDTLVRIYFNTPMKRLISLNVLLGTWQDNEPDIDLLPILHRYPLVIKGGEPFNFTADTLPDHEDGTYGFQSTQLHAGLDLEQWDVACIPQDYDLQTFDEIVERITAHARDLSADLLMRISRCGSFTQSDANTLRYYLDFNALSLEQQADLSLCLLDVCAALAKNENSTDFFLRTVNDISFRTCKRHLDTAMQHLKKNHYALSEHQHLQLQTLLAQFSRYKLPQRELRNLFPKTLFCLTLPLTELIETAGK